MGGWEYFREVIWEEYKMYVWIAGMGQKYWEVATIVTIV